MGRGPARIRSSDPQNSPRVPFAWTPDSMNTGLWGTLACAAQHPPTASARCSAWGPGGDAGAGRWGLRCCGGQSLKPQDRAAWSHLSWARITLLLEATRKLWPWAPPRAAGVRCPPQDTPPPCELSVNSVKTSIIWQNMEVPTAGQQQAGGYRGWDLPGGHTQAGHRGWGGRVEPRTAPGGSDTSA